MFHLCYNPPNKLLFNLTYLMSAEQQITIDAVTDSVKDLCIKPLDEDDDDDGFATEEATVSDIQVDEAFKEDVEMQRMKAIEEYQSMSAFVDSCISDAISHSLSTSITIVGSDNLRREVSSTFGKVLSGIVGYHVTYMDFDNMHNNNGVEEYWCAKLDAVSDLLLKEHLKAIPREARKQFLITMDNFPGFSQSQYVRIYNRIRQLGERCACCCKLQPYELRC